MTNIVCRKITVNNNGDVEASRRAGMRKAGDFINKYISMPSKPRLALFKRLYKQLVENDSFDLAVKTSEGEFSLRKVGNKYKKFEIYRVLDNGAWVELPEEDRTIYKIVTVVDDEDSDADDDFVKMHIAVPATAQNLIGDGYIGEVVSDIEAIYKKDASQACADEIFADNKSDIVKKYLLGTIFLTRCH